VNVPDFGRESTDLRADGRVVCQRSIGSLFPECYLRLASDHPRNPTFWGAATGEVFRHGEEIDAKTEILAPTAATIGYEAQLWQMAGALRGSMDAAEYKHVVIGLIFLKYESDAFEEQHARLIADLAQGADPEDPNEYRAQNIFWVPPEVRWALLKAEVSKQPKIDWLVEDAIAGIERDTRRSRACCPWGPPTLPGSNLL
jgi:hypothetical protein